MKRSDTLVLADVIRRHKEVYEMDGATLASVAESIGTLFIHFDEERERFYAACGMPNQEWAV